jgi:hypothetical protein
MKKAIFILSLMLLNVLFYTQKAMTQTIDTTFLELTTEGDFKLTLKGASHLSKLALKCIAQEFPNKPSHVVMDSTDLENPRQLHPAFYGCFDWHSSVHGHWMLIRLLKAFPHLPEAAIIRRVIDKNLQAQHILQERAYFERPSAKTFERTYGWAWLLKLAQELHTWEDAQGEQWSKNLQPLTEVIVTRYLYFLPIQTYPIRTGVHPNTAFGLAFALDYAQTVKNKLLQDLIIQKSREYYASDQHCPSDWEPNGSDFFSPCLLEADLMWRVLDKEAYSQWIGRFFDPHRMKTIVEPAEVSDRTDPLIVHLDGLNLSRAWCMQGIAQQMEDSNPWKKNFKASAQKHIQATLPFVANGDYGGEHWLASFAVYALLGQITDDK